MQKFSEEHLFDWHRLKHKAMQVTIGLAIGWLTEEQSATNQYQQ